jgi:hypothetical protein
VKCGESTAKVRHLRGQSSGTTRLDEPFTSPFDIQCHVFVFGAKKAAEAGVGERENDES